MADEVVCLSRVCFVSFVDSFVNAKVTPFLIYFPRKGKVNHMISLLCFTYDGSSLFIKYLLARMCEIAKKMPSQGKDVVCSKN